LYDVTDATIVTGVTWTHNDWDADGYVEAGDSIKVTFSDGGHAYQVKAIVGGSVIYESAAFIL